MLPTPEINIWSRRARLIPVRRRRNARANAPSSNAGSSGSSAMWVISVGTPSSVVRDMASPPNVRWSTNRNCGSPSSNPMRTRRWGSSGTDDDSISIWPLIPRWASRAVSPSSIGSQRYLPRRLAATGRAPVNAATKSTAPGAWRRTARGWSTSTSLILRPTTNRSRPRRTTSTSGSSGTRRVRVGAQGTPGGLGGLGLGLLLAAAPPDSVDGSTDDGRRGEDLGVVGSLFGDAIVGHAEHALGGEFLQRRLPVQAGAQHGRGRDQVVHQPVDERRRGIQAAVQIDGADQSLDRVGQDRGLVTATRGFLTPAQVHVRAQLESSPYLGEGAHVDDSRPQLGELTLGQVRVAMKEGVGDDEPEHGVTAELQPLVRRQPAVLVGVRAMGQRAFEQLGLHGEPEPRLQLRSRRRRRGAGRHVR